MKKKTISNLSYKYKWSSHTYGPDYKTYYLSILERIKENSVMLLIIAHNGTKNNLMASAVPGYVQLP
jgi:hypothetical protein